MAKWKDLAKIVIGVAILAIALIGLYVVGSAVGQMMQEERRYRYYREEEALAYYITGIFAMFAFLGSFLGFILGIVYGLLLGTGTIKFSAYCLIPLLFVALLSFIAYFGIWFIPLAFLVGVSVSFIFGIAGSFLIANGIKGFRRPT